MNTEQKKSAARILSMTWKGEIRDAQHFLELMAKQVGVVVNPDFLDIWEAVHGRQMTVNDAISEIEDLIATTTPCCSGGKR